MPADVLPAVLSRADESDPIFGADEVRLWPDGALESLSGLGLLAETTRADEVRCDSCGGDHLEVVIPVEVANRPTRWFIPCPANLRVPVHPDRLRRWAVAVGELARRIAAEAGIAGGVAEPIPGRVWRLGKLTLGGKVWVAFLGRGLGRVDGASVAAREPGLFAANALVLVPGEPPPRAVWGSGSAPVVVRLADLLTLETGTLAVDRAFLASCCGSPSPIVEAETFPTPAGAKWADVTLTVGDRRLTVSVGEVTRRFTHAEAGFADLKAGGKPDRLWALLEGAAANGGVLPSESKPGGVDADVRQALSELRKRLRRLLGLEADPFPRDRKAGEYRAAFSLRAAGLPVFTLPDSGWDGAAINERADGAIEFTTDGTGHADGFDDRAGDGGAFVAASRTTAWTRRLSLTALKLATGDGPTELGEAFLAVLRGRGSVPGGMTDSTFLKLRKLLTTLFQTQQSPFDFRRGRWVSLFTASSDVESPRSTPS